MKDRNKLADEAVTSAEWRGHDVVPPIFAGTKASAHCSRCGAWLKIDANPPPNGVEISGPAVALECRMENRRVFAGEKTFREPTS